MLYQYINSQVVCVVISVTKLEGDLLPNSSVYIKHWLMHYSPTFCFTNISKSANKNLQLSIHGCDMETIYEYTSSERYMSSRCSSPPFVFCFLTSCLSAVSLSSSHLFFLPEEYHAQLCPMHWIPPITDSQSGEHEPRSMIVFSPFLLLLLATASSPRAAS